MRKVADCILRKAMDDARRLVADHGLLMELVVTDLLDCGTLYTERLRELRAQALRGCRHDRQHRARGGPRVRRGRRRHPDRSTPVSTTRAVLVVEIVEEDCSRNLWTCRADGAAPWEASAMCRWAPRHDTTAVSWYP